MQIIVNFSFHVKFEKFWIKVFLFFMTNLLLKLVR
jgi:hypothetical protein